MKEKIEKLIVKYELERKEAREIYDMALVATYYMIIEDLKKLIKE
jgi:hypothetical protein